MTFLLTTFAYRVIFFMFRALSIYPAKPVLSALPVLPLMESASLAGNFGNVNKRLLLAEFDGDRNRKLPYFHPLKLSNYFTQFNILRRLLCSIQHFKKSPTDNGGKNKTGENFPSIQYLPVPESLEKSL